MARVETIIVGGGVGAVAPFALNFIPFVSNTDPPSISTTDFLFVVPTGATRGLIVGTDPDATATERLRITGGMITEGAGNESVLIGRGALAPSVGAVAIGRLAASGATASSVAIGNSASCVGGSGVAIKGTINSGGSFNSVAIAGTVTGTVNGSVAIGGSTAADGGIAIGMGAAANGVAGIAIGFAVTVSPTGGIGIGGGVGIGHTNSIMIGAGGTFAAQQLNIGTNTSALPINTVIVGHGSNTIGTPTGVLFRLTNSSGADNAAGNYTVQPGISTGNAVAGDFRVDVGVPGASSSVLQTVTTRLAVRATVTALDTWLMIYDVDNATLERVSVGAVDSGGVGFKLLRIPN